jgi:hypothetical protein
MGKPFVGNNNAFGYDPASFGRQPLSSINKGYDLPALNNPPPRATTLADYDNLGLSAPNDPRNNGALGYTNGIQDPLSVITNGIQDFPTDQWIENQGTWQTNPGVNYTPEDLEAQRPKFDYMGRPLGNGGQVQWDENGRPLEEVNAQRAAQGLPPLGNYDASMNTTSSGGGTSPDIGRESHLNRRDSNPVSNPQSPYTMDYFMGDNGGNFAGNDLSNFNTGDYWDGMNGNPNAGSSVMSTIQDLGIDPQMLLANPALLELILQNSGLV